MLCPAFLCPVLDKWWKDMIKGETKSPRHLPRALWEEVGISRRVHPEGLTEFEIQRRYYAKLDKELKSKDRIHLMKILDKIDELELDEDFVEVLTSKFKENWYGEIWEKVGTNRYGFLCFAKYFECHRCNTNWRFAKRQFWWSNLFSDSLLCC